MPHSPRPVSRAKFYTLMFVVAFVGILFIGVDVLSLLPFVELDSSSTLAKVQHGFGEALVIAAALGLTVDSFVKNRFAKEVAMDVSAYMAANQLPFGIQDELASLSKMQVYRDDYRLEFRIEHNPGDENIVLTTTVRFKLVNVVDEPYKFTHRLSTLRPLTNDKDVRRITYVEGPGYREDAIASNKAIGKVRGDLLEWEKECTINGNASANFCATIEEEAPTQDSDSMILTHGARNVSVQVISPAHIEVDIDLAHRKSDEFVASGDEKNTTWKFRSSETALLPTQSINLQWKLKEVKKTPG